MTNREQTRRDAREKLLVHRINPKVRVVLSDAEATALLAELEQAEEKGKKAYDWAMHQRDLADSLAAQYKAELEQAERRITDFERVQRTFDAALETATRGWAEAEARLAKESALEQE